MHYSVCFSFHKFFTVSRHISCPTMWFSPFPRFSVVSFLAIFKVLHCVCVILNLFPFPRHNPGPTVDISHFLLFSVFHAILHIIQCLFLILQFLLFLATIQVLQSLFLIFSVFHCFLPYAMSYSVCFSFHILPCQFLIFLICWFSRHIPGPKMWVSPFPFWWVLLL